MSDAVAGALTSFQVQVAQLFFSLPASAGFLLAGGAALTAQRLTARPTQDLDIFTGPGRGDVTAARDAFESAVRRRGWTVRRVRDNASFCRLVVSGPEDLLVDLALDAPPREPTAMSAAGPTFGLEELAGRKLIALFDRAEARDFVDVYALAGSSDWSFCSREFRVCRSRLWRCAPCEVWNQSRRRPAAAGVVDEEAKTHVHM